MAKFMVFWETDLSRVPIDPKERASWTNMMLDMVEDDLKKGATDWGRFSGGIKGYSIFEGATEEKIEERLVRYLPYIKMEVKPVLSLSQVKKLS